MVKIIEETGQRIVSAKHIGDIQVFADSGHEAIDQESIPVVGGWTDNLLHGETASGGTTTRQQMYGAGTSNKLFGTDASIDGEDSPPLNIVGQNKQTVRRRKRVICKDV